MSDESETHQHPRVFRVGRAIGMSFGVLGRNLGGFVILAVIIQLALYLFNEWLGINDVNGAEFGWPEQLASMVLSMLAFSFLAAMVTYGTYRDLRGDKASLGEVVSYGFRLLAPVMVLSIVVTIIYGVGFLLLIVPGMIAVVFLWVAIPAAVIERTGVGASIKRSRQLTKGSRWRLFGGLVLMLVALFLVSFVAGAITGVIVSLLGGSDAAIDAWATQVGAIAGAFWGLFVSVLVAVSYFLLRSQHEGLGVTDLAAVFD